MKGPSKPVDLARADIRPPNENLAIEAGLSGGLIGRLQPVYGSPGELVDAVKISQGDLNRLSVSGLLYRWPIGFQGSPFHPWRNPRREKLLQLVDGHPGREKLGFEILREQNRPVVTGNTNALESIPLIGKVLMGVDKGRIEDQPLQVLPEFLSRVTC
jgi:hypothetical protein